MKEILVNLLLKVKSKIGLNNNKRSKSCLKYILTQKKNGKTLLIWYKSL